MAGATNQVLGRLFDKKRNTLVKMWLAESLDGPMDGLLTLDRRATKFNYARDKYTR